VTTLELLEALRTVAIEALSEALATPFESYGIDGQNVKNRRISELTAAIGEINLLIQAQEPYELRSATL